MMMVMVMVPMEFGELRMRNCAFISGQRVSLSEPSRLDTGSIPNQRMYNTNETSLQERAEKRRSSNNNRHKMKFAKRGITGFLRIKVVHVIICGLTNKFNGLQLLKG